MYTCHTPQGCPKKYIISHLKSASGGPDGTESPCNAGDWGSISGLGRSPGEGIGNPLQLFLPREFHGQRNLVGYSP